MADLVCQKVILHKNYGFSYDKRKMLLLLISLVMGQEINKLVACLQLVKWKIDYSESMFDEIISTSALHPEKLIDKIIADMLENCSVHITDDAVAEISSKPKTFSHLDHLLNFKDIKYQTDEELELNENQDKILEALEIYTNSLDSTSYYGWYFTFTFTLVILYVVYKKRDMALNPKKWFKLD